LIRKSIKLALMHPEKKEYAAFLDDLCNIYQRAVRYRKDGRPRIGRATKARELEEAMKSNAGLPKAVRSSSRNSPNSKKPTPHPPNRPFAPAAKKNPTG